MCNGSKGNDKFNNSRMAKVIIRTTRKVMPALLPPGAIDDIAKVCGCGRKTVYNALRKGMKGPVSNRVKAYCLEKDGTEVENNNE